MDDVFPVGVLNQSNWHFPLLLEQHWDYSRYVVWILLTIIPIDNFVPYCIYVIIDVYLGEGGAFCWLLLAV